MQHLVDGDLASNHHGWQGGGDGTDAMPYFRIFNPVSQGERYDPDGDYVHRWIPSCAASTAGRSTACRSGRWPARWLSGPDRRPCRGTGGPAAPRP